MTSFRLAAAIIVTVLIILYWYFDDSLRPGYSSIPSISIDSEAISDDPLITTYIHNSLLNETGLYGYCNINGPTPHQSTDLDRVSLDNIGIKKITINI